jgi:hypothetical protein
MSSDGDINRSPGPQWAGLWAGTRLARTRRLLRTNTTVILSVAKDPTRSGKFDTPVSPDPSALSGSGFAGGFSWPKARFASRLSPRPGPQGEKRRGRSAFRLPCKLTRAGLRLRPQNDGDFGVRAEFFVRVAVAMRRREGGPGLQMTS